MVMAIAQQITRALWLLGMVVGLWSSGARAVVDCDEMSVEESAPNLAPIIVPCAALEGGLLVIGCPDAIPYGQTIHGVALCALADSPLWLHSDSLPRVEHAAPLASVASSSFAYATAPSMFAWPSIGAFLLPDPLAPPDSNPHGREGYGRSDPEPS